MDTEVKQLHDEVAALTAAIEAAIEEAIKNGKKSGDGCKDTPRSRQVSNKNFAQTRMNVASRVVSRVDDF